MAGIEQKKDETRASYLIRVVHAFMNETYAGNEHLFYDDADCDGLCLADDIDAEITSLQTERDALLAALKGLRDAEWMVSHDWGGDRQSVLDAADTVLKMALPE